MMHISRRHRFVFVAIPRTASKSMYRWLSYNFGDDCPFIGVTPLDMRAHGVSPHGMHHCTDVPAEFRGPDYCRFTIVRNPYERRASECMALYDESDHSKPPGPDFFQEHMATIGKTRKRNDHKGCQWDFIKRADVNLVTYYERLPQCLVCLPFWSPGCGEFPRVKERRDMMGLDHGFARRPFTDLFTAEDERTVWDMDRDDFVRLGYRRHSSGLPADRPDAFEVAL